VWKSLPHKVVSGRARKECAWVIFCFSLLSRSIVLIVEATGSSFWYMFLVELSPTLMIPLVRTGTKYLGGGDKRVTSQTSPLRKFFASLPRGVSSTEARPRHYFFGLHESYPNQWTALMSGFAQHSGLQRCG